MAQTLDISVALGDDLANQTLIAQIVDSNGDNLGSEISDGISEIGDGFYLFHYENYPDDFRGGVKFWTQSNPSVVITFISLNPADFGLGGSGGTPQDIDINVCQADGASVVTGVKNSIGGVSISTGVRS